jgi:hypothetical protein
MTIKDLAEMTVNFGLACHKCAVSHKLAKLHVVLTPPLRVSVCPQLVRP